MKMHAAAAACALSLMFGGAIALDNGRGIVPPRGWRSWDAFENSVNQTLQMEQVDRLVDRGRTVDGEPTSLLDLGYNRIGLDDAWQDCGKGVNHSFHDPTGKPLIRPDRFPDMAAMNAYAKSKGIGSGWYLNTCDCCEKGALQPMWSAAGDARAVKELGFDGLKLDSCGPSQALDEWARLLNATGICPPNLTVAFSRSSFPLYSC
jgi:alpha-galactosidase